MSKTTIYADNELLDAARQKGVNFSQLFREAVAREVSGEAPECYVEVPRHRSLLELRMRLHLDRGRGLALEYRLQV